MPSVHTIFEALGETAEHRADLCAAVSKPMLRTIIDRLPDHPALTLSVGCGSGLLEALILEAASRDPSTPRKAVNLLAVEVPDCPVPYLPEDRVVRVSNTHSVYHDVLLASAILFVYPRQTLLIAQYLDAAAGGALEHFIWFGHRNDFPEAEILLIAAFRKIDRIDGPGVAESEILVTASDPRLTHREGT